MPRELKLFQTVYSLKMRRRSFPKSVYQYFMLMGCTYVRVRMHLVLINVDMKVVKWWLNSVIACFIFQSVKSERVNCINAEKAEQNI